MLALIPFRDPKKRRRPPAEDTDASHMSLHTLPYDLLLNITFYLDLRDIHALHLVSVVFVRRGPRSRFLTRYQAQFTESSAI